MEKKLFVDGKYYDQEGCEVTRDQAIELYGFDTVKDAEEDESKEVVSEDKSFDENGNLKTESGSKETVENVKNTSDNENKEVVSENEFSEKDENLETESENKDEIEATM